MEDLARPAKASMKSAESLCDQSRERRLAAQRQSAASYDAQAAPSNVRLARTMDRMYSVVHKMGGFLGGTSWTAPLPWWYNTHTTGQQR